MTFPCLQSHVFPEGKLDDGRGGGRHRAQDERLVVELEEDAADGHHGEQLVVAPHTVIDLLEVRGRKNDQC